MLMKKIPIWSGISSRIISKGFSVKKQDNNDTYKYGKPIQTI